MITCPSYCWLYADKYFSFIFTRTAFIWTISPQLLCFFFAAESITGLNISKGICPTDYLTSPLLPCFFFIEVWLFKILACNYWIGLGMWESGLWLGVKRWFLARYSVFFQYLQLASHELAIMGINVTKNEIPNLLNWTSEWGGYVFVKQGVVIDLQLKPLHSSPGTQPSIVKTARQLSWIR